MVGFSVGLSVCPSVCPSVCLDLTEMSKVLFPPASAVEGIKSVPLEGLFVWNSDKEGASREGAPTLRRFHCCKVLLLLQEGLIANVKLHFIAHCCRYSN